VADSQQDFQSLMRCVQEGSEDAARQVFERYGPHIIGVIRRLSLEMRSLFDSPDFTQDVGADAGP
jgi:hypothetical protein